MMNPGSNGVPAVNPDSYWCAVPAEDMPGAIIARALRYRDRLLQEGRLDLWRRSERTYYGQDAEGGMANSAAVTFGGEDGELVMIRVNHYASILKGLLATAVSKRPAYEPRASNSDAESAQQVTLARSLLEFYQREIDIEGVRIETARSAELFGEAYTAIRWNPFIGKPVGLVGPDGQPVDPTQPPEGSRPMREGDLEAQSMNPIEVIHDLDSTARDWKWCILAYRENIWDLVARYPQQREALMQLRGSANARWPRSAWSSSPFERNVSTSDGDIVTVWWLYHLPTDAMPQGRHTQVVGDVVLEDRAMDLEVIPVIPLLPEREVAMQRGHSSMFDLLALQEAYDSAFDSMLTQIDAHAVPNVVGPKGTDISPEQLSGKLNFIQYEPMPDVPGGGVPSVLNLLDLSPQLIASITNVKTQMETLSGINQVIRGDIGDMPKLSGAAYALLQSLAVAFNSALQSAVVRHDEHVGSKIISLLKKYARNERQVEIVGTANKGALESWSADKISTITRVVVDVGSPMQQTTAGKLEIADKLLTSKLITTPQEYIQVVTDGRLEPIYKAPKAGLDLIARENELLAKGNPPIGPATPMLGPNGQPQIGPDGMPMMAPPRLSVMALLTDDHAIHVTEHAAVLAEAHVRADPKLVDIVMRHIQEHEQKFMTMGPELGMLTKQSVQPPPIVPAGPPQGPPPPGAHGAPPPKKPGGPPEAPKALPLGHPAPPGGPSMPTNPSNGQPAPAPVAT